MQESTDGYSWAQWVLGITWWVLGVMAMLVHTVPGTTIENQKTLLAARYIPAKTVNPYLLFTHSQPGPFSKGSGQSQEL